MYLGFFWFSAKPLPYFQPGQIDDGANLDEEVHAHDAIYLESIIHSTDFDWKISGLEFAHEQAIDPLGEDKLCASYTANAMNGVVCFIVQIDRQYSVGREHGPCRACIEENVCKLDLLAPIQKDHGNVGQTTL